MRGLRDRPAVPPMAWERRAMSIAIRQLHPFFMGEVSGIDLARKLTPDEAATIEAGVGRHARRGFPRPQITDQQPKGLRPHFRRIQTPARRDNPKQDESPPPPGGNDHPPP